MRTISFTVIMLYPDYATGDYGGDTFIDSVEGTDAVEACLRHIENTSRDGFSVAPPRNFPAEERLARKALAEFDAEHPEVAAKMQADRRGAAERSLASD